MVLDTTRLQPQSSGTPAPAILRPELHATYCVTFRGSKLPDTVGCLLWALVVLPGARSPRNSQRLNNVRGPLVFLDSELSCFDLVIVLRYTI
jgi:hypothetical protein